MNKKNQKNLDETPSNARGAGRGRRGAKVATPERLEKAALWYLERYASAAANLEAVLMRRIKRSLAAHGGEEAPLAAAVRDIVARFTRAGLVDDRSFAEARAATLSRRGKGSRLIRQQLIAKGVPPEMADAVLAERRDGADSALTEDVGDPDFAAAIRYARRRKIGPWRSDDLRRENRQRDMAALGRQGHDYETARRVIDCQNVNALLAEIGEAEEPNSEWR